MEIKPFNFVTRRFPTFQVYANMIGNRHEGYTYFDVLPEGKSGISAWVNSEELKKEGKEAVGKSKEDPTYLLTLAIDNQNVAEELVSYAAKIGSENLHEKTTYELRWRFAEFVNRYINSARYMMLPHALQSTLSNLILQWAKENMKDKEAAQEFLTRMAVPSLPADSSKAQEELLKIATVIMKTPKLRKMIDKQKDDSNTLVMPLRIKRMISKYLEDYAWVPMVSMSNPAQDENHVIIELTSLIAGGADPEEQLENIRRRRKEQVDEMTALLSKMKIPADILMYIKALQQYIFLRTYRMDAFGKAFFYTRNLFDELALRLGITSEEIKYLTHLELEDLLDRGGQCNKKEIEKRMQAFAFSMRNNEVTKVISGTKAEKYKKDCIKAR